MYTVVFYHKDGKKIIGGEDVSRYFHREADAKRWAKWLSSQKWATKVRIRTDL